MTTTAEIPTETAVPAVKGSDSHSAGGGVSAQSDLAARFVRDTMPHLDLLLRSTRRYTRNPVDAEDLLQETLLEAYRCFPSFRVGSNLKPWLLRIMTNTWISTYRAGQRRPEEVLGDEADDWQLAASAQHSGAMSQLAEVEALQVMGDEEISGALTELPQQLRMVVVYADVEGLKGREIAAIMKIPLGTVVSRLHRGRERLRELLANAASRRGYGQSSRKPGGVFERAEIDRRSHILRPRRPRAGPQRQGLGSSIRR